MGREPVVFLSHDGSERHGSWLGRDFEDYVDRLSRLGCVGAEDWQWAPFVEDARSGLMPGGPAACRWRGWVGPPSRPGPPPGQGLLAGGVPVREGSAAGGR